MSFFEITSNTGVYVNTFGLNVEHRNEMCNNNKKKKKKKKLETFTIYTIRRKRRALYALNNLLVFFFTILTGIFIQDEYDSISKDI